MSTSQAPGEGVNRDVRGRWVLQAQGRRDTGGFQPPRERAENGPGVFGVPWERAKNDPGAFGMARERIRSDRGRATAALKVVSGWWLVTGAASGCRRSAIAPRGSF
jgi:hypothetical protein